MVRHVAMGGFIEKTGFPVAKEVRFDEIIDVRAPVEFAEDHISGAINLPVLSDAERAEVGTIYRQESAFAARVHGAALVSRNIAGHIETHFATKGKDYQPLIHCWRGGQRSGSMATVLSDVGWHVYLLDGGYKTYRKAVVTTISERVEAFDLVVLNGLTGAGKTLVLKQLQASGEQMLDLEGLASHKGSVFGGDPNHPQPAQKRFESMLHDQLSQFDSSRRIYIEAESAKIGKLNLPNPLWQKMKQSPVIELSSPLSCRAEYLVQDYDEWLDDSRRIEDTINRLQGFHSGELILEWQEMAKIQDWTALTTSLLAEHYDRRYRPEKESAHFQAPSHQVEITKHDDLSLKACAKSIKEIQFS